MSTPHHSTGVLQHRTNVSTKKVTPTNQTEIRVVKSFISKVGIDFGADNTHSLPPLKLEEIYEDIGNSRIIHQL